jgi:hypothetical protein
MWTTADYALIVSLCSFFVSAAGFIWNIWSKFIYPKPRVRTSIGMMMLISDDPDEDGYEFINASATNHGPGEVTLSRLVTREKRNFPWLKRRRLGLLMLLVDPLNENAGADIVGGGKLPAKLGVGDDTTVHLTAKHRHLAGRTIADIGFVDTFNRTHWMPRKSVRTVQAYVREHLAKHPPTGAS